MVCLEEEVAWGPAVGTVVPDFAGIRSSREVGHQVPRRMGKVGRSGVGLVEADLGEAVLEEIVLDEAGPGQAVREVGL